MELIPIFVFIALLLMGAPLYITVLAMGGYFFYITDIPLVLTVVSFQKLESQSFLSAIPLFTFAGYLLSQSSASKRFVVLSQALFSKLPGSTSLVCVVIMALFTSLTGASGVSILALGGLIFPLIYQTTKNEKFAIGIITSSGSIGLLFAPALPIIIYAIIANQNSLNANIDIETLFFAALAPSFLLIGLFTLYSIYTEKKLQKFNLPAQKNKPNKATSKDKTPNDKPPNLLFAFAQAGWEIPLPIIVYGGIYLGFISVLEASILTAIYSFVVIFFIRKDLKIKKDFVNVTIASLKLSGGIFVIMVSAFILTNYIVNERIPEKIFGFMSLFVENKYLFLLLINVFLLVTGCLLDIFSAILIVLPLIIPLVEAFGINPYHFAIIFLVNLEIGYLTPPVGLNLFIASFRFKKNIGYLYRSIIPFLIIMIATLLILTFVPKISTFTLSDSENPSAGSSQLAQKPKDIRFGDATSASLVVIIPNIAVDKLSNLGKIELYYLDEISEETEFIVDLGFALTYSFEDLVKGDDTPTNDSNLPGLVYYEDTEELHITIADLEPSTEYSVVLSTIEKSGQKSILSSILTSKTTAE